ncbi:MAG: hypothetical protein ACW964_02170, partial [Candidatus Hodarchaeales archaeon]
RKTMKIKKIRENIWTEAVIEKLENREELVAPLWVCTNGTGCWAGYAICPAQCLALCGVFDPCQIFW